MDKDTAGGIEGKEKKQEILRRKGISWETLKKMFAYSEPPGYRLKNPRAKPKIGSHLERIAQIIEEDRAFQKKPKGQADLWTHPKEELRVRIYAGKGGNEGVVAG